MTISSKELEFSNSQVVTTSAASTNIIDLGATGTVLGAPAALVADLAKGKEIDIVVTLDIAATGTSPTLAVALQMDDNAAFTSPTTVATSPTLAGGAAGARVDVPWPHQGITERYIRLNYTTGGMSPSYRLTAQVVMDDQTNRTVAGAT